MNVCALVCVHFRVYMGCLSLNEGPVSSGLEALRKCSCCGSEVTRWMWKCERAVQCVRPLHCGCSAALSRGSMTSASSLCVSLCAHPTSCSSSSDPPSSRTGRGRRGSGHLVWLWCIALCYIKMTPVKVPGDEMDFYRNGIGGGREFLVFLLTSVCFLCLIGSKPHFGLCIGSHLLCVNDAKLNIVETLLKLKLKRRKYLRLEWFSSWFCNECVSVDWAEWSHATSSDNRCFL